jgi:hypothetical protein
MVSSHVYLCALNFWIQKDTSLTKFMYEKTQLFCMGNGWYFLKSSLTLCCVEASNNFGLKGFILVNIRERNKLEKFIVCHSNVQFELRKENIGRHLHFRFKWAIGVNLMRNAWTIFVGLMCLHDLWEARKNRPRILLFAPCNSRSHTKFGRMFQSFYDS